MSICQKIDLFKCKLWGGPLPPLLEKVHIFFLDVSLSLLLPSLLHITCHVSHDIITPKLWKQGPCIFKELALWADSFYRLKCPYVFLFVWLSICPPHFLTPFNGLFAATFWSPTSKLFRNSESLGESNGKKWSHIWTILLKMIFFYIAAAKKSISQNFSFFVYYVWMFFAPNSQSPKTQHFWNPWGKRMARSENLSHKECKIATNYALLAGCFWYHVSHVTCHMSHVTCHMSHVTCHMSHVTYHVSQRKYWWQGQLVECLLSMGPNPSSLYID